MWPDIEGTRNTRPALDRGEAPRMSSRLCPTLLPQDRRTTDSLVDDRTTAPIRVGLAAIRASANSALFTRHFGPPTKSRTRTPRPGNRALVQFGKSCLEQLRDRAENVDRCLGSNWTRFDAGIFR